MKTFVKIVVGLVVFIMVAVAAVFYFTSGMVKTADAFFQSVKQQDLAKARGYLSEDFKASTDEVALRAFLTKGAILNFKEASWSERSVSGGRGELNGSITTDTKGVVPIKLMFVKESGTWKIYAIQKPTAGLQSEEASPAVPNKADQVAMIKQAMRDFATSVNNKNMEHFRNSISQLWQKEVTTEKLNTVFAPFIEKAIDLTILEKHEPTIDGEPKLGENGRLVIKGVFPTKPSQVYFEQKFIYEGTAWKLVGLSVDIK
jgi:hypothetical protein